MSMTLDLPPDLEVQVKAEANRRGQSVSDLISEVMSALLRQSESLSARDQVRHSIMELRGIGKGVWRGIDVDAYINEERNSWDQPR